MTWAAGCAVPNYAGRWDVAAELTGRTHQQLGPEIPAGHIAIPDLVNWEDGLSEEEAVAVALWNNPGYQELLADLDISQADVIQANQIPNPQIVTMFPLSAKQWEFTLRAPLDVLVLRPRRVAAAQLEANRVAERLVQDGLNVMRDVRTAYADLVQAEGELELAEQTLKVRDESARIAAARLKAGAESELGVSAILVDSFFNKQQVVQATRNVELTRERLRFLLGVEMTDLEWMTVPQENVQAMDLDVDHLVEDALASRPDLRALDMALWAASERAQLARRDYFNIWGLLPDINSRGEKGFEAGPGLAFDLPIFHQNQGAIARAQAEANRLERQLTRQRDTVALEVRQAYATLVRAQEELALWRESAVPQAAAAMKSAEEALKEDGVPLLLLMATTGQFMTARQGEVRAAADVRRAVAELERSVGHQLLDGSADSGVEELPPVRHATLMDPLGLGEMIR